VSDDSHPIRIGSSAAASAALPLTTHASAVAP